jgi:hypothetical protein
MVSISYAASGSGPNLFGPAVPRRQPISTNAQIKIARLASCKMNSRVGHGMFPNGVQGAGQHVKHQQPPAALVAVMQPLDANGD